LPQDVDVAQRHVAARTWNLAVPGGAEPWQALVLDVERPRYPALRVEAAGLGSLTLRQNATVVLMAQVVRNLFGVDYALTGQFLSPIPPIRADLAASLGTDAPSGARRARWAHRIAVALTHSRQGPLHTGRWVLSTDAARLRSDVRASTLAERWEELVLPGAQGYIDWFVDNGAWQILPLRPLASPDTGRVKAYRKQARQGILAPVLLWWISGLDCYVLLDGHDRLVAALVENEDPPLLCLSSVSAQQAGRNTDVALSRYTRTVEALERQVAAGTSGAADALAAVNRRLAESLKTIETAYGVTRAWPLRGGTAGWNALAEAHVPDWHAEMTQPKPSAAKPIQRAELR
jgi:hypothetical protein